MRLQAHSKARMNDESISPSLLDRAREGQHEALEELLTRNRSRFQRAAGARLGEGLRRRVRASDVLQSTYVDVLSSIQDFRGTSEEDFARWVVRILETNIRDASPTSATHLP